MQYKIFTIPIVGGDDATENLNKFLRANKTVKVDKELAVSGDMTYWTFCVQYLLPPLQVPFGEKKDKVDYKAVLNEEQFKLFSLLRKCRKAIADEEAIPAFAVFIDSELAEMSKLRELNEKTIVSIDGIGKQRVDKFARRMLEKMYEENRKPDTTNS
ncbi:MAG: HRDC domain-containing protein [Bacteroidales bacterium]|nr:HRDC domain-containing protein [Bacteroidales bacterium]